MTRRIHLAVESGGILGSIETQPVCGNDFHRRKVLTDNPEQVTCRECLSLSGYDAVADDQLTECQPDPLPRAA